MLQGEYFSNRGDSALITFKFYTPEEVSMLVGDDKLELVIELRERMRYRNVSVVAVKTGLTEQTVKNFVTGDVTLPRNTTISLLLDCLTEGQKPVMASLSLEQLQRIQARSRNRMRPRPRFKQKRASVRRAKIRA